MHRAWSRYILSIRQTAEAKGGCIKGELSEHIQTHLFRVYFPLIKNRLVNFSVFSCLTCLDYLFKTNVPT